LVFIALYADLDEEEDVNQLLRTAASVKKELRPFPVARAAGIPYRPMLFTLHLDLRDADPVTRNFHSLRAAVMKAVSGGDIGRAEIIARCPDLARQDDPGAAFDRVLQMDSWCGHCGETLPDNALASELHEYRRNGAPPTYGLSQNVACTICGHPDNPHDMALCDRCGCGVHQACMGQDLRRTFLKALGNNADWFCHCEPTQESGYSPLSPSLPPFLALPLLIIVRAQWRRLKHFPCVAPQPPISSATPAKQNPSPTDWMASLQPRRAQVSMAARSSMPRLTRVY
jgi:hypothetical protein